MCDTMFYIKCHWLNPLAQVKIACRCAVAIAIDIFHSDDDLCGWVLVSLLSMSSVVPLLRIRLDANRCDEHENEHNCVSMYMWNQAQSLWICLRRPRLFDIFIWCVIAPIENRVGEEKTKSSKKKLWHCCYQLKEKSPCLVMPWKMVLPSIYPG